MASTPKTQADAHADAATIVLHHTDVRLRGQRITLIGVPCAGLLAITGYGTPHPRALGLITTLERDGQPAYRIYGHDEDFPDLDAAAAALAARRGCSVTAQNSSELATEAPARERRPIPASRPVTGP